MVLLNVDPGRECALSECALCILALAHDRPSNLLAAGRCAAGPGLLQCRELPQKIFSRRSVVRRLG